MINGSLDAAADGDCNGIVCSAGKGAQALNQRQEKREKERMILRPWLPSFCFVIFGDLCVPLLLLLLGGPYLSKRLA